MKPTRTSNRQTMTSKKKTGAKKEKKEVKFSNHVEPQTIPAVKPGIFSPAQFTFLILLSMGISRILQLRSAYGEGEDGTTSAVPMVTPTCSEHLGEVACMDKDILSLLKLKFHSSLQLTALCCGVALQCWNHERLLLQLKSLFIISPMGAGIAVMFYVQTISHVLIWKQAVVCLVLSVLAVPSASNLPFLGKRTNRAKSLTSMVLAGLTLANVFRAVHFAMMTNPTLPSANQADTVPTSSSLFVVNPLLYHQLSDVIAAAAKPIVLLLAVDAITAALVYALSWYCLSDHNQRTVLLLTAVIKLIESFLELPSYTRDGLFATDAYQTTLLTTAFVAGVGWIVPPLSFKKNLGYGITR